MNVAATRRNRFAHPGAWGRPAVQQRYFPLTRIIATSDIFDNVSLPVPLRERNGLMCASRMKRGLLVMGLLSLLAVGCAGTKPSVHDPIMENVPMLTRPRLEIASAEPIAVPESLEELLAVATKHHPDLQAAEARAEAARGRMMQAGLHPNPLFGPRGTELMEHGNGLGQSGVIVTQQFVTANKLGLSKEAGARGVEAADWQAYTQWYDVVTRARLVYFELLTALRDRDTIAEIVRISEEGLQAARNLEKAGVGNRPDILRAKVLVEQNRLKHDVVQRRVEAARQNLLTALGRPAVSLERLEKNREDLEHAPPDYEWNAILEHTRESSSELQEARALIAQQEKLLARAKADAIPNVETLFIPYVDTPTREFRFQAYVAAPLPLFNRNQGNIHAAQADLARTHAEERQLELRLTERLTVAYQRYQAARRQTEVYNKTIVPDARESLKLVEAGYRRGDPKSDYTAVLQAQQILFEAQLAQTQAMGDLWRAVVEVAGILQQENLLAGCGKRLGRNPNEMM